MHFRHSSGEINNVKDFFIKGKMQHLRLIMLLLIGLGIVKFIIFYYSHPTTTEALKQNLILGYCIFAVSLFVVFLFIAFRRERYRSYSIKNDIIFEYFKDTETEAIKITSLAYIKSKLIGDRVNYLIFFKKNRFLQMKSFGLIDPKLASDLDKYFFSKGIEKWDYERIPK